MKTMKLMPINLCGCGCGEMLKPYRGKISRFVNYHYVRTEEWKREHSKKMVGNKSAFGNKFKLTKEQKARQSTALTGHVTSEETKRKISESHKGKKLSEEHKRNVSKALKGRVNSKESIKKRADGLRGKKMSAEAKHSMSIAQKKLWADPIFHKQQQSKMANGHRLNRPNKPETELLNLLQNLYPSDWKFVGDGDLIIGGKNPDFANVNGKKILIELFGDYWHRNDSPRKRMGMFKPYGFRTLVIWEHELQNQKTLVNKINHFVNY